MSEENVEIVRGAHADFNAGNTAGVLGGSTASSGSSPGSAPSGTFNGPEAVGRRCSRRFPRTSRVLGGARQFKDEGDQVIVTGRFKGKAKSGAELMRPSSTITSSGREGDSDGEQADPDALGCRLELS
jgi:hypothetical protein